MVFAKDRFIAICECMVKGWNKKRGGSTSSVLFLLSIKS